MIGGNYTPAPWHIDIHADGRGATIYALRECDWLGQPSVENRWQAQVTGDGRNITSPAQVLSVAHMMWAAPDLREVIEPLLIFAASALRGADMDQETRRELERDVAQARAAIAKAEGGAA
jgi:hypothetical protein